MSRVIKTLSGGAATVRRVEQLGNRLWRAEFVGGLVKVYAVDPRPAFTEGREPTTVPVPEWCPCGYCSHGCESRYRNA